MKSSTFIFGLISFVACAWAAPSQASAVTKPESAPAVDDFQNAVQLKIGLLQSHGNPDMCLAAIKIGDEVDIQLQLCDNNSNTQIWSFNKSKKTIQLAFPEEGASEQQCLVVYKKPPQFYHLTVAPCTGDESEQFFMTDYNGIASVQMKDYCMDVPFFNYYAGARVKMWPCKDRDNRNQQWVPASISV
ncbi:hypothetical protein BGZ72_002123 [Mortierella alpina]|nr:hypothetical protein BGZ72_002123 [Mortierella alpina]